jgi:hypothetical protein
MGLRSKHITKSKDPVLVCGEISLKKEFFVLPIAKPYVSELDLSDQGLDQ